MYILIRSNSNSFFPNRPDQLFYHSCTYVQRRCWLRCNFNRRTFKPSKNEKLINASEEFQNSDSFDLVIFCGDICCMARTVRFPSPSCNIEHGHIARGFSPAFRGIPDVSAKDVSAKTWRRTFRFKKMPKRIRLKTFAETFRMICGAYPVYARSPSLSQRPAPTTIASRSPFPLGLCSCSTSLSKMGI